MSQNREERRDHDAVGPTHRRLAVEHFQIMSKVVDDDMEEAMKPTPAEVNPWDGLIYVNGSDEGLVGLPACKNCHGSGQISAGRVPYGSTTAELPPDVCEACCGTCLNLSDARCAGLVEYIKQEYQAGYEEGAEWAFVDDDARRPDRFRKAEEAVNERYKV